MFVSRPFGAPASPRAAHRRSFRPEPLEPRRMLAVQLVADLNTNTVGSVPEEFVSTGSTAYFAARSPAEGISLWKSDGTPAGTTLVRGNLATSQYPGNLGLVGQRLYFTNTDAEHGRELWTSDGTAAGTTFLADLNPGAESSEPGGFTPVGDAAAGRAVFWAQSPAGYEPFVTDGTAADTMQLADINPGPASSLFNLTSNSFGRLGDVVIFSAVDASGAGLWKTDGTPAGTTRISSLNSPNWTTSPSQEFNGSLYFAGPTPSGPLYGVPWRTDGTPAGTGPLVGASAQPYNPSVFTVSGDALWFAGSDLPNLPGGDWWRSDGTAAGTVKAIDLPEPDRIGTPLQSTGDGHFIFFTWDSSNADNKVWWSDGTTAGSHVIKTFKPLDGSFHVDGGFGFRVFAPNRVMFLARDAEHGKDFWVTDGTPEGTVPLDLNPGPGAGTDTNGLGRRAVWVGDKLVFQGATADGDAEPFVTDGTLAGTHELADINAAPADSTISRPIVRLGNGAILSADNKLYFTDGTPGGTVRLADLNVANEYLGSLPATPHNSAELNGVAIFPVVNRDGTLRRVYRSDGTPAGTYALGNVDPFPGTTSSNAQWPGFASGPFVRAGNFVYFFGSDGSHGVELWKTDGTVAGTSMVADIAPGAASSIAQQPNVPAMTAVGDTIYFKVRNDELWKSDGTAAGTQLVKDLNLNYVTDTVHGFVSAAGKLFFEGPANHFWVSDGTGAGTLELLNRIVVSPITPFGNGVAFWAYDGLADTIRLFASDGTLGGTRRLGTVALPVPPPFAMEQTPPVVSNGVLYFVGRDAEHGWELWKSDGTDAGTVMVADIRPGTDDSRPDQLAVFDGRVYFFANDDGTHGRELWSTDGTDAGTRLEKDIYPGPTSSTFPPNTRGTYPVATGDELLFVAQDDTHGRELFRVTGTLPGASVVGRHVFYNHSALDGGDAAANASDDAAIATDKSALVPGQAASFANATSFNRGLNGIFVDITGLPQDTTLTADDFAFRRGTSADAAQWTATTEPRSITVRRGAGVGGSDRVTLVWDDSAPGAPTGPTTAVADGWLEVTVKATPRTGLARPDVFAFGNIIGDTGDDGHVTALDVAAVKRALNTAAAPDSNLDFNRDGRINALDVAVVKRSLNHSLALAQLPPPVTMPAPALAPAQRASVFAQLSSADSDAL